MEDKCYTVYMHICPNGKRYIGITGRNPQYRWNKGKGYLANEYFTNAIKKYKWENINHIILYQNLTKKEAEEKEIELIAYYKSNEKKYGYNIENGGNIKIPTQETKNKISKTLKTYKRNIKGQFKKDCIPWITGKKHSEETKEKIRQTKIGEKNPMYGKKNSQETIKKKSESMKGHIVSKETKNKISIANSKKVICLETDIIYDNITQASINTKTCRTSISECCKGKKKSAGGMHWKYVK